MYLRVDVLLLTFHIIPILLKLEVLGDRVSGAPGPSAAISRQNQTLRRQKFPSLDVLDLAIVLPILVSYSFAYIYYRALFVPPSARYLYTTLW